VSAKTLVCRCEDVTLDEVEEALAKGHRDIESVKRYTGFGTGWCQGKQCVVACARLLAARTGATPTLPITPRPPVHPVSLGALAALGDEGEK
jgi:bacterioferritin-associated ferredoxin